jgi:hypothetical protein
VGEVNVKRNVVINVPSHVLIAVFASLLTWAITGDGHWAFAYGCGMALPILIAAWEFGGRKPVDERSEP